MKSIIKRDAKRCVRGIFILVDTWLKDNLINKGE